MAFFIANTEDKSHKKETLNLSKVFSVKSVMYTRNKSYFLEVPANNSASANEAVLEHKQLQLNNIK